MRGKSSLSWLYRRHCAEKKVEKRDFLPLGVYKIQEAKWKKSETERKSKSGKEARRKEETDEMLGNGMGDLFLGQDADQRITLKSLWPPQNLPGKARWCQVEWATWQEVKRKHKTCQYLSREKFIRPNTTEYSNSFPISLAEPRPSGTRFTLQTHLSNLPAILSDG